MSLKLEKRVDTLESVLQRFIANTERSISSLSEEMKMDRAERNKDREEWDKDRKERSKEREEWKKIREEWKKDREEWKKDREDNKAILLEFKKEMNKKWGDLANKMGSLVEDIIVPGIHPTLRKYFNAALIFTGIHMKKNIKSSGLQGEFDMVASDDKRVYLIEVKSSPDKEKVNHFIENTIPKFRQLFPEYDSKILIPIMGSLRFDADIISYASKMGIYVMGYREWEYLDILNFDEVKYIESGL